MYQLAQWCRCTIMLEETADTLLSRCVTWWCTGNTKKPRGSAADSAGSLACSFTTSFLQVLGTFHGHPVTQNREELKICPSLLCLWNTMAWLYTAPAAVWLSDCFLGLTHSALLYLVYHSVHPGPKWDSVHPLTPPPASEPCTEPEWAQSWLHSGLLQDCFYVLILAHTSTAERLPKENRI